MHDNTFILSQWKLLMQAHFTTFCQKIKFYNLIETEIYDKSQNMVGTRILDDMSDFDSSIALFIG